MDIGRFHKKDIAKRQLQTALELFFAGGDLFSVVTLAAASEEMLGELLRQKGGGGGGAFRSVLHLFTSRKGEPVSSGTLKESECYLHMDPRQEAVFLLGRCIDDYRALEGDATEEMLRFDREIRGEG
ncbi:hypothetical protein GPEL0_01r2368 [Geoanaerobacter pelophilus]|uniref:Uncharacterized protein n=1 Tax=Geoanaerobacter pelophilus TaxID=60036 RepID=A0ABQ0MIC9_9BACT|nr:hypothetical protein [Geoanaerobacter pelophilus]GAW66833.1 hypothetical protein GPEL0_01r2368 [Geoanaerobacter pelophilus]